MGQWLRSRIEAGAYDGTSLVVDYHDYLNWDGALDFPSLRRKVCGQQSAASVPYAQYLQAGLSVLIGGSLGCGQRRGGRGGGRVLISNRAFSRLRKKRRVCPEIWFEVFFGHFGCPQKALPQAARVDVSKPHAATPMVS